MDSELKISEEYYALSLSYKEELKNKLNSIKNRKQSANLKAKFNTIVPKTESHFDEFITINTEILKSLKVLKSFDKTISEDYTKITKLQMEYKTISDEQDALSGDLKSIKEKFIAQYANIEKLLLRDDIPSYVKQLHNDLYVVRKKIKKFTSKNPNISELIELKKILYKSSESHDWNVKFDIKLIIDQLTESKTIEFQNILQEFFLVEKELIVYDESLSLIDKCFMIIVVDHCFAKEKLLTADEIAYIEKLNNSVITNDLNNREKELGELMDSYDKIGNLSQKLSSQISDLVSRRDELHKICRNDMKEFTLYVNLVKK